MPRFTPYPADVVAAWEDEPIQAIVLPHDACGFLPDLDEYRFPQYGNQPLYRFACAEEYCYPGHAAYGDDDLAPTVQFAADIWNANNHDWHGMLEDFDDDPAPLPDSDLLAENNPLRFYARLGEEDEDDDDPDDEDTWDGVSEDDFHDLEGVHLVSNFFDDEYQGDGDRYEQDEEEPPWAEGEEDIP